MNRLCRSIRSRRWPSFPRDKQKRLQNISLKICFMVSLTGECFDLLLLVSELQVCNFQFGSSSTNNSGSFSELALLEVVPAIKPPSHRPLLTPIQPIYERMEYFKRRSLRVLWACGGSAFVLAFKRKVSVRRQQNGNSSRQQSPSQITEWTANGFLKATRFKRSPRKASLARGEFKNFNCGFCFQSKSIKLWLCYRRRVFRSAATGLFELCWFLFIVRLIAYRDGHKAYKILNSRYWRDAFLKNLALPFPNGRYAGERLKIRMITIFSRAKSCLCSHA